MNSREEKNTEEKRREGKRRLGGQNEVGDRERRMKISGVKRTEDNE